MDDCLGSLRSQTFRDFEVIFVDNGSSDGSIDHVRKNFPEVILIVLAENRGFAGGNNAGIGASSGRYIAFLNNDTRTDPGWLAALVRTAEADPGGGMWASKILSFDNPNVIDNVGLLLYWDGLARGKGRLEIDAGQFDKPDDAFFPSGCACLYRKRILDESGLFDEDFFAYADDVDLGLRARLMGWECRYVPDAIVFHKYSASSSAYSPLKAFLVERNRIWVLLKYYPCELVLVTPYFTIKRLALSLYGAFTGRGASGKFAEQNSLGTSAWILLKAWCAALAGSPRVLRQRLAFSKLKKLNRKAFYQLHRRFSLSTSEIALKE